MEILREMVCHRVYGKVIFQMGCLMDTSIWCPMVFQADLALCWLNAVITAYHFPGEYRRVYKRGIMQAKILEELEIRNL